MENLGVKLVRQAGAKTNDLAGDGCTTSIILAQGLISEGVKVWFFSSLLLDPYEVQWSNCRGYKTFWPFLTTNINAVVALVL